MRARLTLQIEITWSEPVRSSNQILRLRPRPFDSLHVLDWFVGVEPQATLRKSEDGFSNLLKSCSHAGPLDRLLVTAEGLVETEDAAGVVSGLSEKQPVDLFLRHCDATGASKELEAFAKDSLSGETDKLGRMHVLMAALHKQLDFTPEDATPRPASEVFAAGKGSARELAQVFVAAARAQHMPARFVSGLLLDGSNGAACHAWAEIFIEELGWIGFDSALGYCPRDQHLRLAHGVDYISAAPRRGAFIGYPQEKSETRLEVEAARQASWQAQGQQ